MASIYRVKRAGGKLSRKWYAKFFDAAAGKWRVKAGYVDKQATIAFARRLEVNSARRAEGLPSDDDNRPLSQHLDEWYDQIVAGGATQGHARSWRRILDVVSAGCGWTAIRQLNADTAQTWLAKRRASDASPCEVKGRGKRRRGLGAVRANHYIAALRGFGRWLTQRGRLTLNPFATMRRANVAVDRRHTRRALSSDQFKSLVAAALAGPVWRNRMPGEVRAALYLLGASTGLRISEIVSLTPQSIDLTTTPATIAVEATTSKRRRRDVLPLRADVCKRLEPLLARCKPGQRLFPIGRPHEAVKMLRIDLAAAGIPYADVQGKVFDFHALRGQFITSLPRAGVGLTAAQKLARHSTPTLTSVFYTHLELEDLAGEVRKLDLPPADSQ